MTWRLRNGNEVTISWTPVILSDDKRRGNMLELIVCQQGNLIFMPVQTDDNTYTVVDGEECEYPSSGLLYTAEKHGYSDPVQISLAVIWLPRYFQQYNCDLQTCNPSLVTGGLFL